jgi:hypothetical protein
LLLLSLLPVPALPERGSETPKKCDSACCARKVHASCPHHKAGASSREPGHDGPAWKNAGACPRNCTNATEAQRSFAMDGAGSAELWLSAAAFQLSTAAGRTPHAYPLEYSLRQRPPPSFETPAFAVPAAG